MVTAAHTIYDRCRRNKTAVIRMAYVLFFCHHQKPWFYYQHSNAQVLYLFGVVRLISLISFSPCSSVSQGYGLTFFFFLFGWCLMTKITAITSCLFRVYVACIHFEDWFIPFHTHVDSCRSIQFMLCLFFGWFFIHHWWGEEDGFVVKDFCPKWIFEC